MTAVTGNCKFSRMRQYKPFVPFEKGKKISGTRLTPTEILKHNGIAYLCRCECGRQTIAAHADIVRKDKKSCGCLRSDLAAKRMRTHGLTGRPEYYAALNAFRRCTNPKDASFKDYGGRGIKVEFKSPIDLAKWLVRKLPKPAGVFVLDRINNSGNYASGNMKWSTRSESARNRRDNNIVTIDGVSKPMVEWSDQSGVGSMTILNRIRMKYPDSLLLHKGKISKIMLAKTLFDGEN